MAQLTVDRFNELAFFNFHPRADQPEKGDQQNAFVESRLPGVSWILGGNGCLASEQEVYDPVNNCSQRVDSIDGEFHVWARDGNGNRIVAKANRPSPIGPEKLYEFTLIDGRSFRATMDHRCLNDRGEWETLRDMFKDHRCCLASTEGELKEGCEKWMFADTPGPHYWTYPAGYRAICKIEFIREDIYWDFHVPIHENYWMEGVWHHNSGTTTTALYKMVDFLCFQQAPPRKDCPFWVIGKSFEQVMNVAWKEKLHQRGHLNPNDIDWSRISWHRPNQDWPARVPLKPWPGRPGKNWQIVFKSYEQGRGQMMGESIGGFLFIEQFPWGLLEEVIRGCREYDFVGNKLCEFTPVDPGLCSELRDMEETGTLPAGWGIFRANTRCALEAGHVTKQWYDSFFAMLPEQTRRVREQGLWGNFEGAVYPEWNPLIHCTPKDWKIPPAWYHHRAVDWGFSVDHPLVCLWMCFSSQGDIVVYDEYWSNDTNLSVIDHWKQIEDRYPWPTMSPYYGCTWVDHNPSAINTLAKIGEYTDNEYDPPAMQLARKDVHEGLEYVKYLLKPSMLIDPKLGPQPRLRVVKEKCPNLCREMISYRWLKRVNTGINANAPRDEVVKDKDDAVDALRYGVFSRASMMGMTPSTIAKQHSTSSVQLISDKFNQPRRQKRR